MRQICSFLLIVLISSCSPGKYIPLSHSYNFQPYESSSKAKFSDVWDRIIDLFAKNGIGIKLIDKSSGFIIAQKTAAPVTFEAPDGKPYNEKAWLIADKYYDSNRNRYYHVTTESVEWNIHVVETHDGTRINVNLMAFTKVPKLVSGDRPENMRFRKDPRVKIYSTGVFENLITDYIK